MQQTSSEQEAGRIEMYAAIAGLAIYMQHPRGFIATQVWQQICIINYAVVIRGYKEIKTKPNHAMPTYAIISIR